MNHGPHRHAAAAVLDGRFVIRGLIAEGGMGAVYEAELIDTGERGALKLMQPKYTGYPLAVERFAREAMLAGRIHNPHIVKVLDAGRLESGEPYMFMERLQGEALRARIEREGRLDLAVASEVVSQAAAGLIAAHAAGIVHRDVKPENLFLLEGSPPFVKILDFGISKFTGHGLQALTRQGLPMGTWLYMPPEQMMGAERVDERADVYSLGVVLYEALVGRPPFVASGVPALMLLMHQQKYEPISRVRAEFGVALDSLLARCLAAEPDQRYATMGAFRDELAYVARLGAASSAEPPCAGAIPGDRQLRSTPEETLPGGVSVGSARTGKVC